MNNSEQATLEHVVKGDERKVASLVERLDAPIGETSTGIGMLMAELIRRSLKSGVSDLDSTLREFAEQQVDDAVECQMPRLVETAEQIAAQTSERLADAAVQTMTKRTAESELKLNQAIETSASQLTEVFTSTKKELESKVDLTQESLTREIDATKSEYQKQTEQFSQALSESELKREAASQQIEEMQQKSRDSWKKLSKELNSYRTSISQHNSSLQRLQEESSQLKDESSQLKRALQQTSSQLQETATHLQEAMAVNRDLRERLEVLEAPKGIKKFLGKIFGKKKAKQDNPKLES